MMILYVNIPLINSNVQQTYNSGVLDGPYIFGAKFLRRACPYLQPQF